MPERQDWAGQDTVTYTALRVVRRGRALATPPSQLDLPSR